MNSGEGHHVGGGPTGSQPASDDNPMDTLAAMMTKLKVGDKLQISSLYSGDEFHTLHLLYYLFTAQVE